MNPRVRFFVVDHAGVQQACEADAGDVLMETLRELGRVDAICGGSLSCGTCAVRIAPPWADDLPLAPTAERDLVSGLGLDGARLSCQLRIDARLDGMVIEVLSSA